MSQFDDNIKADFLLEADELIEGLEATFLRLEQNPDERGIMDHIFRLVHTVKGSAYSAGFEELGAFAHVFETLLNKIREGRAEVDRTVVDLLLRSNDQLRHFIAVLKADHDASHDTTEVAEELRVMIGEDSVQKWTGPAFGFFDEEPPPPAPAASEQKEFPQEAPPIAVNLSPFRSLRLRSIQQPIILVCDDEPELLDLIVDSLRQSLQSHVEIMTAADGLEALEKISGHRPHVVITDLRMPKVDGIEFVTRLRSADRNVPVMVLSGYAERQDMIEFIKLGVSDYMDKPVRPDIFVGRVNRLLHIAQIREAIERLSVLNFRTHMNSIKLLRLQGQESVGSEWTEQRQRVENMLEEIAALTNFVLTL